MKDGFIKISTVAPRITVADTVANTRAIIDAVNSVGDSKIIVCPELCVCGATVGDLVKTKTLLDGAKKAVGEIVRSLACLDALVVIGAPVFEQGKIYNCALIINHGKILGAIAKKFVKGTAFASAPTTAIETCIDGQKFTISENTLFACDEQSELIVGVEVGSDAFAVNSPSLSLATRGATVIVNPCAFNQYAGRSESIHTAIKAQSQKLKCAYALSNAGYGESTTDEVYDGVGIVYQNGTLLVENQDSASAVVDFSMLSHLRADSEEFSIERDKGVSFFHLADQITDILHCKFDQHPFVLQCKKEYERVLTLQSLALAKRIESARSKKIVLGLSGGLDSTLALIVAVRTVLFLGRDMTDIIAVTMPCFGTTVRTKSNAQKLAESYGVTLKTVDIAKSVRQHLQDIGHDGVSADVTYENAQARERTQVIMDIANMHGGIVLGTGDLSEVALGWSTYNGDHMSMYGVNSSVPKTLVRALVEYESEKMAGGVYARFDNLTIVSVLNDILDTPVSPELTPAKEGQIAQITEDIVGPYELHDFFLYNFIVNGYSPRKILRTASVAFKEKYGEEVIKKWLINFFRRFFTQQFKRSCMPDGPKVTPVSLSPRGAWKMPSDAGWTLWLNEIE